MLSQHSGHSCSEPYIDVLEHPPIQQGGGLVTPSTVERDIQLYRSGVIAELGRIDVLPIQELPWDMGDTPTSHILQQQRGHQAYSGQCGKHSAKGGCHGLPFAPCRQQTRPF